MVVTRRASAAGLLDVAHQPRDHDTFFLVSSTVAWYAVAGQLNSVKPVQLLREQPPPTPACWTWSPCLMLARRWRIGEQDHSEYPLLMASVSVNPCLAICERLSVVVGMPTGLPAVPTGCLGIRWKFHNGFHRRCTTLCLSVRGEWSHCLTPGWSCAWGVFSATAVVRVETQYHH